jgi:hypothetical protein
MEFIDIKKSVNLSAEQMNAIDNNFQFLKHKLITSGFPVDELVDNSVNYSIAPINIIDKFQNVEQNIQTIHDTLLFIFGADEKFYKKFTWKTTTPNRKAEIWRWIDWINEAKKLVYMYEVLCDVDEEQVYDSNNEIILVLQERE